MKLILKEVVSDKAGEIDEIVTNGFLCLFSKIWDGQSANTYLVEIEFENPQTTFASYLKNGIQMFEFMDLDEESMFYGNALVFEIPLIDFNSYEVV